MPRQLPAAVGALVAALALAAPASALARPGDLDPTFAGGGPLVVQPPSAAAPGFTSLDAIAVDAAGRVLASGSTASRTPGAPGEALVLRATAQGAIDTSFADGGFLRRQFSTRTAMDSSQAVGVAPAPGGGVGFGVLRYTGSGLAGAAFRLGSSGQPDVEHGTGGLAEGPPQAADPTARVTTFAHAQAADGSAFIAGWYTSQKPGSPLRAGIVRFTPQGTPDGGFGAGGLVVRNYGEQMSSSTTPTRLALLPGDDRLLVAGTVATGPRSVAFLAKLEARTGFADSAFTDAGTDVRRLDPASPGTPEASSGARAIALAPDGSTYVGGGTSDGPQSQTQAWVARLRPTGELDPTWGDDGYVRLQLSRTVHGSSVRDLVVQPDGRLVAGVAADDSYPSFEGDVLRFDAAGRLDRTFAVDGVARLRFDDAPTGLSAIALDGDRLVVGGYRPGGSYLARMLLADPPADDPQTTPTTTTTTPTTPQTTPTTPATTPTTPATSTPTATIPPGTSPAPPPTTRGRLSVTSRRARVDARGRVALRVRCSAAGPCGDRVLVVAGRTGSGTRSASATPRLAAGATTTVRLRLTATARRGVTRGRTLRAYVAVVPAGGGARATTPLALRRR